MTQDSSSKIKRHLSIDSSDDDVPLKILKIHDAQDSDAGHPRSLHKYSMETCNLCHSIFHTRFDYYIHKAKHARVAVTRMPIYKCTKCTFYSISQDTLNYHAKNHVPEVPDILKNFISKKLVVRCDDSITELINSKKRLSNDAKLSKLINEDSKHLDVKHKNQTKEEIHDVNTKHDRNQLVDSDDVDSKESIIHNTALNSNSMQGNNTKRSGNLIRIVDDINSKDNSVFLKANNTNTDILENLIKKEPIVQCDDSIKALFKTERVETPVDYQTNEIKPFRLTEVSTMTNLLENIVMNNPVIKCDSSVNDLIRNTERINKNKQELLKNNTPMVNALDAINKEPTEHDLFKMKPTSIRSRLIFEDDDGLECDDTDFDFENNRDLHRNGVEIKDVRNPCFGKITLGSKPLQKSVHYDELMETGDFYCDKCSKRFNNRFESIVHEKNHLQFRFRRPALCHICDRYIANYTLRPHIEKMHPNHKRICKSKDLLIKHCDECGLKYYNFDKHSDIYHNINIDYSNDGFKQIATKTDANIIDLTSENDNLKLNSESAVKVNEDFNLKSKFVLGSHKPEDIFKWKVEYESVSVRNFCEVCAMFLKNGVHFKYTYVASKSAIGQRQMCDQCHKEFFEVKVIRTHRLKTESKGDWKKKPKTNTNRLKSIQQRMKKLSKLTRV